jgi:hypothetical protein
MNRADQRRTLRGKLISAIRHAVEWGEHRVPRGVRSVLGILCMIGGVAGFLPVLGFWMIPVGLALIALDIPPLRLRLLAWIKRHDSAGGNNQESTA